MTKIIWMSDLHFVASGRVQDHDPRARLKAAIAFINAHHGDAACCVISGDLVDRGTTGDYAAMATSLRGLNVPLLPMVGNHDNRKLLRAALPLPQNAMSDFVQYAVATPEAVMLCLDLQLPGSDAGVFCEARRDWLDKQLARSPDVPHVLFMHHPPMPLGLPMQDQDRMQNGEVFLDLIAKHANVAHLFMGHVHRPVAGTVRGMPYATIRSVLYQAPAPCPPWDWSSFQPAKEAPELGVITLSEGAITLQYQQFCPYETGTRVRTH